jgi:hypothetical protein
VGTLATVRSNQRRFAPTSCPHHRNQVPTSLEYAVNHYDESKLLKQLPDSACQARRVSAGDECDVTILVKRCAAQSSGHLGFRIRHRFVTPSWILARMRPAHASFVQGGRPAPVSFMLLLLRPSAR